MLKSEKRYFTDKNGELNRGCPNCGKVQMQWGTGWHDWEKGWTYQKAIAYVNARNNAEKRKALALGD